jgi:hypothetical protein
MKAIINEHHTLIYNASSDTCKICAAPKARVLISSMTMLHEFNDPHAIVLTFPTCGKAKCEEETKGQMERLIDLMANLKTICTPTNDAQVKQVMHCIICKTTVNILKCGRCGIASYCGKEHQKIDWESHKQVCKSLKLKAESMKAKWMEAISMKALE